MNEDVAKKENMESNGCGRNFSFFFVFFCFYSFFFGRFSFFPFPFLSPSEDSLVSLHCVETW